MNSKAKNAAIGACIALFANMGMNSTFTIFLTSFAQTWPDSDVATIALAATFGCLMAFIWSTFLVGPILKKTTPRALFFVCAILSAGYCLIHYFSSAVWMLIVAGLLGGSTLGLGTHAMGVAAVTPYFADYGKKVGTVIAVVLASAALGAAAFSFIPGMLIPVMGWRNVYLVMGAVIVVCNLLAVALIPKTEAPKAAAGGAAAGAAEDVPGLTVGQALRTPAFWLVFLGILFLTINYQGLCTYMPTFLVECGMTQSAASSMQGIMQLVGIVFIIAGGALINKIGIRASSSSRECPWPSAACSTPSCSRAAPPSSWPSSAPCSASPAALSPTSARPSPRCCSATRTSTRLTPSSPAAPSGAARPWPPRSSAAWSPAPAAIPTASPSRPSSASPAWSCSSWPSPPTR